MLLKQSLAKENIDSLWGVWNDIAQPDTTRLQAMKQISWGGYLFTQPDSAFIFAQLQYDFAKEKDLKKYMAVALNTQGVSFAIRGNSIKAIDYFNQGLQIKKGIGDKAGIASSLNNIGNIYKNQGDYTKAIEYFSHSLKLKQEVGDKRGIANTLQNIGNIYYDHGDFAKAIDHNTRSLIIWEEIGDKLGIANTSINIGVIYQDQHNLSKAIDYFTQSLKIYEEIGNKQGVAISLNNTGSIYQEQGDYEKAIDYYTKSLKGYEAIGNKKGIASSLINIGKIYKDQGEFNLAIKYSIHSLKIREEIEDKKGIANSLKNIGLIYIDKGDYIKALGYGSKALKISQSIGAINVTRATAKSLWKVNKSLGRYQESLEMYELYITTRDSVESEENQKEVIRQEFTYDYEKKSLADSLAFIQKQGIKQLAHNIELEKEANQRYMLYGGLGFLLLLGAIVFRGYQRKKEDNVLITKQKHLVEEKNSEILDSITYAKRIQDAILPPTKLVNELLPDSIILYKPKDIVAGDFYWMESVAPTSKHKENLILFAVADCTGHGVPGAMVSVVCHNAMNRAVREFGETDPGAILDKTRELVLRTFERSEEDVKDGMDIALCNLISDKESWKLEYAGAHNPLWIIRDNKVLETKANKEPIGKFDNQTAYTTHSFDLQKGDTIYIFTDGFVDQFGGEKEKKFKAKAFRDLLISIQSKSMNQQQVLIDEAFESWKADLDQVDDVCVMGVRI